MKNKLRFIIIASGILFSHLSSAQDSLYVSKNLNISFFSKTSVEDIDATSHKGVSAISLKNKDVFFRVPLVSFEFRNKLMEEHFNENYVESDKYPNASFRGRITSMTPIAGQLGAFDVKVTGKLNLHNVEKEYTVSGILKTDKSQISIQCKFTILIKDHNIEIPRVLSMNVAEKVEANISGSYQLK